MQTNNQTIYLGGGCFWCTEAIFRLIRGVISVTPGFSGGSTANPTYEMVCSGKSGHAEVIKVEFDPDTIPLIDILDIFFHTHDPTSLNRQGADEGLEYRSIILYVNEEQRIVAEDCIYELNNSGEYISQIVTEVIPLEQFYEADRSHKAYYEKNSYMPYCQIVISPKLAHLRQTYAKNMKTNG
jgi:peptide-methionine (S)-S-oxide reductase